MGKMFTGVAVARLIQAGKVHLRDRVGRYIPSLPKRIGKRVTVGELLDHTSGLGEYFQDPGYERLRPTLTKLRSYLPLISRERLPFAPDTLLVQQLGIHPRGPRRRARERARLL